MTYETTGNGYFVTLINDEGDTRFLQGDDAAHFLSQIDAIENLDRDARSYPISESMMIRLAIEEYF